MKKLYTYLLFFTLFVITSCDTTEPTDEINYHNKILFSSSISGIEQLYMMDPDGTNIKQITSGEYSHSSGRWSLDATQIVAKTDENYTTAGSHIVTMNSDGSNRKLLPVLAGDDVCWSPDGNKIAFSFMPSAELYDRSSYIFIVDSDGTDLMQLTNQLGTKDNAPTWSHDGNTIYFSSNREDITKPYSNIYKINIHSLQNEQITFINNSIIWGCALSKDGEKIAFNADGEIVIMKNDGADIQQITFNLETRSYVLVHPCWSSDGNELIMSAYSTDGLAKNYIYIVNIDGSNLKKMLDDPTANSPDWSL
jgi:Tol biopolymer transport system component